jgi:hypothetical protein
VHMAATEALWVVLGQRKTVVLSRPACYTTTEEQVATVQRVQHLGLQRVEACNTIPPVVVVAVLVLRVDICCRTD